MKPLPLVTVALVFANLAVYASGVDAGAHGLVPAEFVSTGNLAPVFSSMFLHASLEHLLGNMVALAIAGTIVEGELGHLRFLGLYLAAGIVGALLHVLVAPAAAEPMVGASGAIFGVLAVAGALRPRLAGFAVGFVLVNVWYALAGNGGAVSFGTHLGGAFVGALFAIIQSSRTRRTA